MTSEELRRMRKSRKMTQADLAAALGYSRKSVISWENAVHPIPEDVAAKVLALCFQPVAQVSANTKLIKATVDAYRDMRNDSGKFSHAYIVKMWADRGFTPAPEAQAAILAEWPDIDPRNQLEATNEKE